MYDQYNRKIDYLRISLTDRCNLRCKYCFAGQGIYGGKPQVMSRRAFAHLPRCAAAWHPQIQNHRRRAFAAQGLQ